MGEMKVINQTKLADSADSSLVALLEEILVMARKGEITSIAGVFLHEHYPMEFTCVDLGDEVTMLGAIDLLKDAYKREHLSEDDEE